MKEWRTQRRGLARKYASLEPCSIDHVYDLKKIDDELRSTHIRVNHVYAMLDLIEDQNLGRDFVLEVTELVLKRIQTLHFKIAVPILMRLLEFADVVRQAKDQAFDGWTAHFGNIAFSKENTRIDSHFERICALIFHFIPEELTKLDSDGNLSSNSKKLLKSIQFAILANQEDYLLPWRFIGQTTWDLHFDSGRALHQVFHILLEKSSDKFGKAALYLAKSASHFGGIMDYKSYSIDVSDQAFQEGDEFLCKTVILRGFKYISQKSPDEIDEEFLAYLRRVFPKKSMEEKNELDRFVDQEIFSNNSKETPFVHSSAIRLCIKLRRCDIFVELISLPKLLLQEISPEFHLTDSIESTRKKRKISYEWTRFKLFHDELLPFLSITRGLYELRRICPTNLNEFISHAKQYFISTCSRVFEFLTDIHFRASLLFWTCMDAEPSGIACFTVPHNTSDNLMMPELWTKPDELISNLLNGYETVIYNSIPGTFKQFTPCSEELNLALSLAKLKTSYWLQALDDSSECSRNGFLLWLRILYVIFRNDGSSSGAAFLHFLTELSNDPNRTPKVAQVIIDKILTHRNSLNVFFDEVKALARGQSNSVLGISSQILSDADLQILGFRPIVTQSRVRLTVE
jgi:hypothetical protein